MKNKSIELSFILSFALLFFPMSAHSSSPVPIISKTQFDENGTIERLGSPTYGKAETGRINGVEYRFWYSSGTAQFANTPEGLAERFERENWSIHCDKDQIYNIKSCFMSIHNMYIHVDEKGVTAIRIGTDLYPDSSITLKIDNDIFSADGDTGFRGKKAIQIIEKLKTAQKIITRYSKWPNEYTTDSSGSAYGFNEAYKYINWAVNHLE